MAFISFAELDEGGPSNWNVSNYNNDDENYNHNGCNEDNEMVEQRRIRRHRCRVALAFVLALYAILSLEPRLSMNNNIYQYG